MKKVLSNTTVLLIILLSIIPIVHAQTTPQVIEKTFDGKLDGQLTIDSDLGSIDVKTANLNKIEIVVTKKAEKLDKLLVEALNLQETFTDIDVAEMLKDFEVTFEQKEDNVYIKGQFKTGREQWEEKLLLLSLLKIHFQVKIPHGYSVNVNTSKDPVSIPDLSGDVKVQTSIGDLRIGEVKGPVWGRISGSGSITLKGCQGNVDVQASIGDIDLGNVTGNVKAKTGSSGSITLKGCQGNVDIVTSIGDIKLGDVTGDVSATGGDIDIGNVGGQVIARASSSGNITLTGCESDVDVKASIGDIDLGSVSGIVKAKTGSSGSITLEKCESDVDVEASIGDVELSNIAGAVKARGGDIGISNVTGAVIVRASSSGRITLKDCQDNVDVEASIGDIDLTNIIGTVNAKTSGSGNITLNHCQGGVNVTTSMGDIRAEITKQSTHQWTLETSGSGQITATLIPQIAIDIDAQTNRGNISSDFVVQGAKFQNTLKGTINGGGTLLKLRTSYGDIRLQKK